MRTLIAVATILALATSSASAQQTQSAFQNASFKTTAAPKAMTYAEAFKKAKVGDKPLLVLVTADWCPPCRQLKASTLPTLIQRKSFRNFHFAMMDYDKQPELAKELIEDRGLPQLIMFEKSNGKWLRRTINGNKGIHSVEGVEMFVAKAGTVRFATQTEKATNKK